MAEFHAPYHFIPTTGKVGAGDTATTPWDALTVDTAGAVRHDHWPVGLKHGRVVCKLTLKTPTVVGGRQTRSAGAATVVEPYCIEGQPALPASSLRGMVGAVAEAISQSALRVLDDNEMSVRKEMSKAIAAIGLMVKADDASFQIIPFSTEPIRENGSRFELSRAGGQVFANRTWKNILPVYLDGYEVVHDTEGQKLHKVDGSFLAGATVSAYDSVKESQNNRKYWARLAAPDVPVTRPLNLAGDEERTVFKVKRDDRSAFLLGQRLAAGTRILTQEEYDVQTDKNGYSPGVLFVFGIDGREDNLPETKRHEYFIPWPTGLKDIKRIAVPGAVRKNFEKLSKLADPKGEGVLPYLPRGYVDARTPDNLARSNLKPGRLIRFATNGQGTEVTELSWSAIWRRLIEGTTHEFFGALSPDLLPWNRTRNALTPAESLFGVTEAGIPAGDPQGARNLASRLRFSDAVKAPGDAPKLLAPVPLKILASPKPPSPAMYFRGTQGASATRRNLTMSEHRPRGRKVYLHHSDTQVNAQFWKTAQPQQRAEQKLSVTPLAPHQNFWFHIDFDNLTDAELTLLLRSLDPSAAHMHRLGLGKPLGLGSVHLDIAGTFLIDRIARYRDFDPAGPRYHHVIAGNAEGAKELDRRYPKEANMLANTACHMASPDDHSLIDTETLSVVRTFGDKAKLKANTPVAYPYSGTQGPGNEQDGFKWFVRNERARTPQSLKPVTPGQTLPTLESDP